MTRLASAWVYGRRAASLGLLAAVAAFLPVSAGFAAPSPDPDGAVSAVAPSWVGVADPDRPGDPGLDAAGDPVLRWTIAPTGNEARYRVREQLVRFDFPNDAVGATTEVRGGFVITEEGRIDAEGSGFRVNLAALASDNDRRDNFLRRNTLGTEAHPEAVFRAREVRGIDLAGLLGGASGTVDAGDSGEGVTAEFELVGDLTIRETTRQVVWAVTAEFASDAVEGAARTSFTFDDFDLEVPRVGSVLSVNEEIRLEYDFRLVPEGR